jgi:plastocyanin
MAMSVPRLLVAAAAIAIPLAACGDDDEGGGGGGDLPEGAVVLEALDSLEFRPDAVTADAGEVTFGLVNEGSLPHTFVIEDLEDDLKLTVSGSGATDDGSIELEAGDYVFYCDIPGHRGGGMEGTLTVE